MSRFITTVSNWMGKKPVAFYARVSSEEQAKGDSVENQFILLEQSLLKSIDSDDFYTSTDLWYADEGISAHSTRINQRDDLQRLLTDAKNGLFGMVMVKHSNRLARDNEELTKIVNIIENSGVRVKIVLGGGYDTRFPETKLFLTINGMFDEKFSNDLSVNMSASLRTKVLKGLWASIKAPLGYRVNKQTKKLEIFEERARIVRDIFDMYVNKRMGTQLIATTFLEKGFKTELGYSFDKSHILHTIKNQAYIGHTIYGKTRNKIIRQYDDNNNLVNKKKIHAKAEDPIFIPNTHESIIDDYTFWKAQEIMKEKSTSKNRRTKAKYPLVGIIRCGNCGSPMICQKRKNRNYRYYKCSKQFRFGTSLCTMTEGVRGFELEGQLLDLIILSTQNFLFNIEDKSVVGRPDTKHIEEKITNFNQKKRDLSQQQRDLLKDKKLFEEDVYQNMMLDITREIKDCNEQISILQNQLNEVGKQEQHGVFAEKFLERLQNINRKDEPLMRALFHDVIQEIVIQDKDTIQNIRFHYDFLNASGDFIRES